MNDRTRRTRCSRSSFRLRSSFSAAIIFLIAQGQSACGQATDASDADLIAILTAVHDLRQPQLTNGVPDYTVAAVERQKVKLAELRAQFDRLDPADWPVRDQVDYPIVRSELDMLKYGLYVYRATSRSPNFNLSSISSFGLSSGATLSKLGQLVQPRVLSFHRRCNRVKA